MPSSGDSEPSRSELESESAAEAVIPKDLLSVFGAFSRTTTGPDPETAKILASVEMKAEDNRLRAYEATLRNRDEQSKRDDAFRRKRLNHESALQAVVVMAALIGIGLGTWLKISGQEMGGYIVIASFTILVSAINGKFSLPKPPAS